MSVAPLPNYEYGKGRGDYEDYGRGAPAPQDMDDPYARVLYRNRNVNSQSASRIHQQGSYLEIHCLCSKKKYVHFNVLV